MDWILLAALVPIAAPLGFSSPPHRQEEVSVELPGWALLEVYSCTACHASPTEDGLGVRTHAPALDQGWYQADYIARFLDRPLEHEPGTKMPDLLDRLDPSDKKAAIESLEAYFAATAVEGGAIGLDLTELETGRQLYHSIGCVACHPPYEDSSNLEQKLWDFEEFFDEEASAGVPATPFPDVCDKYIPKGLSRFLASPSGHAPELPLEDGEERLLANYIWFEEQGLEGIESRTGAGLLYEYFEGRFEAYLPYREGNVVVRTGIAPTPTLIDPREDDFAFRYRGFIDIPRDGWFTFYTVSDDGSLLWIDGELVVDNGGVHAAVEKAERVRLEAGKHAIQIGFFEHGGGAELSVEWEGPGIERQELPAERLTHRVISAAFEKGSAREHPEVDERILLKLGCLACHTPDLSPAAGPLARLRPRARAGCLAASPKANLPRYSLNDDERASILAAIEGSNFDPEPAQHLAVLLQQKACHACHQREGTGGPDRERMTYFQVDSMAELGDEGRIPPPLDGAGSKLHAGWMEEVIRDGARSRPYMHTRMPSFPEDAAVLTELFQELDHSPGDLVAPEFSVQAVEAGRDLVGIHGLGCIQCHDLAGYPSLGVPAVDLAKVHERIKPAWFKKLLLDPIAINMNTRMPTFWTDGRSPVEEHYDGDPAQQIDALWSYLTLGNSMPLPEGLVAQEGGYELGAAQRPTLVSVFGKGLSPRTLFVGYPERIHIAFDLENSRLALAWRGRFFNARGTWHGRAGELEEPSGEDVLAFPPGPPFALLEEAGAIWPEATGSEGGYRVLGRRFDAERRPIFRYALGAIEIEERPIPRIGPDGGTLTREFRLTSPRPVEDLFFRDMDERIPVAFARDDEGYRAQLEVEVVW